MKKKYESPSVCNFNIALGESYLLTVSGEDTPGGGSEKAKEYDEGYDEDYEW